MSEARDTTLVRRAVVRLGELLPYIGIVSVTLAFLLVTALGRIDLGLRGLYLAIPIMLASVWLIRRRKRLEGTTAEEDTPGMALSSLRFTHLTLLNALIFIASIILLLLFETRPPGYFVLMAAFAGIVFVQVLGMARHSGWQKAIILGSLLLLALNLTWGITLKYPLYIGATDIPAHLLYTDSILQSSHVTAAMTGGYQYVPLYHIFFASGIEVLGLGLRDGFFILAGLAYVPVVLFSYLVFKAVTRNERLSLIACLLFAVNATFIYYGGYMVTRALAFVFFVMILYLLFRQPRSVSTLAILGLFTVALVLTHQTTLVYVTGILALLVGFWRLLGRPQANPRSQVKFASIYLTVFVVVFMSYWFIAAPVFVRGIVSRIPAIAPTQPVAPTPPPDVVDPPPDVVDPPPDVVDPPPEVEDEVVPHLPALMRQRIPDMIFLFLAWPGIAYLLRRATDKRYVSLAAIGVTGLVCLVFYVENPLHLFPLFTRVFLVGRIRLLLTVLMSLAMAFGVVVLTRSLREHKAELVKKAALPLIMGVIVAFSFFSITSGTKGMDVPEFRNPYFGERRYFTVAELSAFSFVEGQVPTQIRVYSCYLARRYFRDRRAAIITHPDIGYIEEGCLILRTGELEERWLLFSGRASGSYSYSLEDVEPADNILEHLALEDRVYDNGTTEVYMIPASHGEDTIH